MNKRIARGGEFGKTYITKDSKDTEPRFEIPWEFPPRYLDKNMADMDTSLVTVENY